MCGINRMFFFFKGIEILLSLTFSITQKAAMLFALIVTEMGLYPGLSTKKNCTLAPEQMVCYKWRLSQIILASVLVCYDPILSVYHAVYSLHAGKYLTLQEWSQIFKKERK